MGLTKPRSSMGRFSSLSLSLFSSCKLFSSTRRLRLRAFFLSSVHFFLASFLAFLAALFSAFPEMTTLGLGLSTNGAKQLKENLFLTEC